MAAVVGDDRLTPEPADRLDLLGEPVTPRRRIDPQSLVLTRVPTDRDSEAQATAAEQVDLGRLLGDQRRRPQPDERHRS